MLDDVTAIEAKTATVVAIDATYAAIHVARPVVPLGKWCRYWRHSQL